MKIIRLFASLLLAVTLLAGHPVLANASCNSMAAQGAQMSHSCCNGEHACCRQSQSSAIESKDASCSCAGGSAPPGALMSLSLRLVPETYSKAIVSIASLWCLSLLVSSGGVRPSFDHNQWRPPKIGRYLFYRVLRI